jgi:ABC-type glycerol-3-phosphate transport system permease component
MVLYDYLTQNSQMVSAAAGFQSGAPTLALQMAVVTITIIPVLIVYPFVQKHFTKGVLLGAVKG